MVTGVLHKAIIIDDEINAIEVLQHLIKRYCPQIEIVATTCDSEQGEELIRKHVPQLLFLDIEMPKQNGFQLLEKVDDLDFNVVFTTAYDQYALRAFRFSALDYIMKPIGVNELIAVVERLDRSSKLQATQLNMLKENLLMRTEMPERIALPHLKGYIFQDVSKIIYCEANNTYTRFYIEGRAPMLISKPLGELEEILTIGYFFRIHRQYLVNVKKIVELLRTEGGAVIMDNGDKLPIARNRKQELIDALVKY